MKRSYSKSQLVYGLMLFILSSCGSKMPENSRGHSEFTSVVESSEDSIRMNTLPKVDSQLQFNVMVTTIFQDSKGNFWFGSRDPTCRRPSLAPGLAPFFILADNVVLCSFYFES